MNTNDNKPEDKINGEAQSTEQPPIDGIDETEKAVIEGISKTVEQEQADIAASNRVALDESYANELKEAVLKAGVRVLDSLQNTVNIAAKKFQEASIATNKFKEDFGTDPRKAISDALGRKNLMTLSELKQVENYDFCGEQAGTLRKVYLKE